MSAPTLRTERLLLRPFTQDDIPELLPLIGAREVAATLPGPAHHHGIALDHMDPAALEQGFADAVAVAHHIDILVNNGHEGLANDWTDVTAEQFSRQLANATGYFLLARLARNHAVARGAGASIILLGSMYGVVGSYPDPYEGVCAASPVAYHTLKGGLVHMTRHLAVYWAKDGVRVNCLYPGLVPTDMGMQLANDIVATGLAPDAVAAVSSVVEQTPLGRLGEVGDMADAAVFLCSNEARFITGAGLPVDGGMGM